MTTTLLIVGLAALLTGCGKGGYATNDDNSGSNLAQSLSTKLTQEELETLAQADQQEMSANITYRSISDIASATASLQAHLANIADLSAQFDSSSGCTPVAATSLNGMLQSTSITWNCAHAVGSISQTDNVFIMPGTMIPMISLPQTRALDLTITGHDASAHLVHNLTDLSSGVPKRSVDDLYTLGVNQISVKGQASLEMATRALTASYDVVKNGGDVDTITVSLDGVTFNLMSATQPVCGGSVTYETSSGLTYSKAFPACASLPPMIPGIPGLPGFPGFPGIPGI